MKVWLTLFSEKEHQPFQIGVFESEAGAISYLRDAARKATGKKNENLSDGAFALHYSGLFHLFSMEEAEVLP